MPEASVSLATLVSHERLSNLRCGACWGLGPGAADIDCLHSSSGQMLWLLWASQCIKFLIREKLFAPPPWLGGHPLAPAVTFWHPPAPGVETNSFFLYQRRNVSLVLLISCENYGDKNKRKTENHAPCVSYCELLHHKQRPGGKGVLLVIL